ncbi:putative transcription factor MYB-HB-like family [Dioscorea sansibarensis]
MTRRCSACSHNGHNARTCPGRGVKIFGVRFTDGTIRKSASMGNLSHYAGSGSGGGGSSPADGPEHGGAAADGYASEDFAQGSSSSCRERKRGVPWTEEEHRMFLIGLQKLGKGDWRGISRNFVVSRSPTQVASHAQKYFIRQANASRRKRRSSLFDIVHDETADAPPCPVTGTELVTQGNNPPSCPDEECESMDSNSIEETLRKPVCPMPAPCTYPVIYPAYFSPFFPFPRPCWPGYIQDSAEKETHEIVKPTATYSKTIPINIDELIGMSKLSIGDSIGRSPSALSLGQSDRQSAFQPNLPSRDAAMNSSTGPIRAS